MAVSDDRESILNEIKKMLGPSETYDHFDTDIIIHINSALNVLKQLGVGPTNGFRISSEDETWADFWDGCDHEIPLVKDYIYAKVKLAFDPPTSSFAGQALQEIVKEMEWRANIDAETPCFQQSG